MAYVLAVYMCRAYAGMKSSCALFCEEYSHGINAQ